MHLESRKPLFWMQVSLYLLIPLGIGLAVGIL